MKTVYCLFLFLLSSALFAFEFNVSELTKDEKGSAVTIEDVNDVLCARLLIYSDIEDITFSAYGQYGKVAYSKENKYYTVYLSSTTTGSVTFKRKDFYNYTYRFNDKLISGATYKINLSKKNDSKNPADFDGDKDVPIFESIGTVFSSVVILKKEFESDCKSIIYILSDLPIEVLSKFFNKDTTYFSCNTESNTEPCNEEIKGIDKLLCVKKPGAFNSLLASDSKHSIKFTPIPSIDQNSAYKLLIKW